MLNKVKESFFNYDEILNYIKDKIGGISLVIFENMEYGYFKIIWIGLDEETNNKVFLEQKFSFEEFLSAKTKLIIANSFVENYKIFIEKFRKGVLDEQDNNDRSE